MKNIKRIKRNATTKKTIKKRELLRKITVCLKSIPRQTVTFLIINTLFWLPLLTVDSSMLKVFAQSSCTGADRIVQGCALGGGQVETDLTNGAIDDVISFYNLPPTDRDRVMRHGRSEVRSMLYARLIALIKKPNKTAAEQSALDTFTARIREKRVLAAQTALDEYNRWSNYPCAYQPPAPYTYNFGAGCYGANIYFPQRLAPSFEEFEQFGAAVAYAGLNTPEAQDVSIQTTQGIAAGAGAGAVLIGGTVGAAIGSTITFGTLSTTLFPFILKNVAVNSASAASGAVGSTFVGGAISVVIIALSIAILASIQIANQAQLPGKLQQALINAQTAPIFLPALTLSDAGNQELYGAFLLATFPDFPGTDIPPASPSDRQFEVRPANGGTPTDSATISYVDWEGLNRTARLSGGWFIENKNGVETQRLSIQYLDGSFQKRTASRSGRQFIITDVIDFNQSKLVDEIQYLNQNLLSFAAKIKYTELTVSSQRTIPVDCDPLVQNPDPGTDVVIGSVAGAGESPSSLVVTVNNASSATVNNVTVRNLAVDGNYQVTANVSFPEAPIPTNADFTFKVRNSLGQEQSAAFTIRKTAVIDSFISPLPTNVNVGDNYSAPIEQSQIQVGCVSYTYAVTSGSLPPGTSLQPGSNGLIMGVRGILKSGGLYKFEISKIYANGERVSRPYTIFVKSDAAELPNNFTHWWRAENNADAITPNRAGFIEPTNSDSRATLVGSVSFETGKVGSGWKFDGTNGYVEVPPETFNPANDFSLELWFQTRDKGVILGRQNNVSPYDTPQYGATPAIYVDQNGRLRVQIFQNQNNEFTTSQSRVDDNAFHHVAVTYQRTSNARTVYLDGVNIGSTVFPQSASGMNKYQFGTGFVNDGTVGGLNGWINFNGVIDETTLYSRPLTPAEILAIYTAGGAGKIAMNIDVSPLSVRNGNDAAISIAPFGGIGNLSYSINGGTSFQNTGSFINLTAGTYSVVLKDGNDNTLTRSVTIENPPPNLNLTTTTVAPLCSGSQDGEIRIFATGGSGQYEYSVLNGGNKQSSYAFTGLSAGNYTPWIRDVNSDTVKVGEPVFLRSPQPITLAPTAFPNAQVGTAYSQTFTISGGTAPYNTTVNGTNSADGFALPDGLNTVVSGDQITIRGTPTVGGTFLIRFASRDQNTCFQSYNFPLTIIANGTVSIGGKVSNGGQGLPNATVTLSGGANQTATTNNSGDYVFSNLSPNQNYTASVSLAGYTFAQPSIALNSVNADVSAADFPTAFIHYEGDIAPRTAGDGAVNVLDFIALRRIRANLDPIPANGGEWQRTSIAPRSQLGSITLAQSDENQMLNYILGIDPLTLVGGPTSRSGSFTEESKVTYSHKLKSETGLAQIPSINPLMPASPAQINAVNSSVSNGAVSVPLVLNSDGNTTAVQFTVTYDAAKLTLASVTTANQDNTVARNAATSGKVSILAYRVLGGMVGFPQNTELLRLNFTVNQGATGSALIDFTDAPTQRIAVDPQANPVALNSSAGLVAITAPTAAGVAVSGRVLVGSRGLINATIYLTDQTGETKTARTTAFGYFRFDDIPAGQTYIATVVSKRYKFQPRVVSLTNNLSDLNFVSLE